MKKGMLIVFEGIDFSGKTTLISCLKTRLAEKYPDREVVFTHQPSDPKIRELLLDSFEFNRQYETDLFYFLIDRRLNFKTVILPALKAGKIVVCDRFFYSTFVYQADFIKKPFLKIEKVHKLLDLFLVPDIVFFINPDINDLLSRKSKQKLDKGDHFAFANLKNIKSSYEKVFAYYKTQNHPIFEINSTDLPKVCSLIYKTVSKNSSF